MNNRAIFISSFFLKIIFVASLFILIFISGVSYKYSNALTESTELLVHSYKIQTELERLIYYLTDAETGQRGFIISRDTVFLEPYNSAREKINKSYHTLKSLTADHPQQLKNLDSVYHFIYLRFALLVSSLEKSYEPLLNKDLLSSNLIQGKNLMNNIRSQINQMIETERTYLTEHQKKYDHEISFTPVFTLILLLFSLVVFIFSYIKINNDLVILKKSNQNLLITTESFKHAEEIGGFSSWQWNLDTNELIYSDNQYRLLGCEPQSFDPTIEKILEFVHPDDRDNILESVKQLMNGNDPSNAFFRIIRNDGELRYFKSIGKLFTDVSGKKTLLGINIDITEQHLSSIELEERNHELEQSNKELASFNHIASHDLQEPLRKIQTFISRITEKESLTMSEAGKEYFAKIQTSAHRMRILIDDLLLFSRTNKTEKNFEKTDLNLLLENAKQELAQAIEEKNAVIQCAHLPVLYVIPFQIQQLFINLVGNSLKYCKPGIAPLITIDCEKIIANEDPILITEAHKNYYKISVTDNGLGFEQQYAENIFILFHRLHQITEYPGTGIGLSICKKILDNHSGFITAEGKPNIGSTFSFYLPEFLSNLKTWKSYKSFT